MNLEIFTLAWVVLLVTVLLSHATSSKNDTYIDPTLNFVVFVDDDVESTKGRINMARKQLNSTGGDTIEKTIIISVLNQSENTFESYMQEQSKKWKKSDEAPAIVFDFTQRAISSALVKRFSYKLGYPLVSTNHITDDLVWNDVTSFRNNTVQLRSPDQIVQDVVAKIIHSRYRDQRSCFQSGITVKFPRLASDAGIVFDELGPKFPTDRATNLVQMIDEFKLNNIFTYGTAKELTGILKGASKRNLLNEYHAWWATLSDYEESYELPKNVNKLILLSFEFFQHGLEKTMKNLNTKSITDLFYVDVIVATCKTFEAMKKNKSWTTVGTDLNLRLHLSKRLLSGKENIFGRYSTNYDLRYKREKTNFASIYARTNKISYPYIWELEVKGMKAELLTPGNRTTLGKTEYDAYREISFTHSTMERLGYYPVFAPLRATIVVDPPFVIKNETCVGLKKKTQQKLMDCYSGYVIDVLEKLRENIKFNYSIESETAYGEQKDDGTWTGARGALSFVQNEKRHIQLGIGAFRVYHEYDETGPQFSIETEPFFFDNQSNQYYGFLFGGFTFRKYNIYTWEFNYGLRKLRAQRYFDHLREKWISESGIKLNTASKH